MAEIQLQRHQGKALFLGLPDQFLDLPFVHQQLPVPERIHVEPVPVFIGADVEVVQVHLAGFGHCRIGILQVGLALTEGFHLRAGEHDAGFIGFVDVVVMPGFPVFCDYPLVDESVNSERQFLPLPQNPAYPAHPAAHCAS